MREALFPFSNLRHPRQHQGMEFSVTEFLRSFNLHSSICQIMCRKILSFARQFDGSFKIEAKIDYMEDLIWNMEVVPELLYPISIISEEAGAGAPESVIERLRKQKFEEEEEEMEECCVCCEDLEGKGMEVSRIPCGHFLQTLLPISGLFGRRRLEQRGCRRLPLLERTLERGEVKRPKGRRERLIYPMSICVGGWSKDREGRSRKEEEKSRRREELKLK
ncbi:unnamed protein product [Citrullus colocynthis]|uniref:RING-type domain-containing protein n=1 Tax=Citrullus colocynthis TaxID=252529 RepID=A0ABP0Y0B0_9ROSI